MFSPYQYTGVSLERQQIIWDILRAKPRGSYILGGAPGTGKTTFSRGLESFARAACWKNFAVYSQTAAKYQADVTAAVRGEHVSGLVKPSSFDNPHGIQWAVFLDDVDKITDTAFISKNLFELFNAICDERKPVTLPATQLVLTTNLNKEEFKKRFGDHVWWRLSKYCNWISVERAA